MWHSEPQDLHPGSKSRIRIQILQDSAPYIRSTVRIRNSEVPATHLLEVRLQIASIRLCCFTTTRQTKNDFPVFRIRDMLIRTGSLDPYTGLRIGILLGLEVKACSVWQWLSNRHQETSFFSFFSLGTLTPVFKENMSSRSHWTVEIMVSPIFLLVDAEILIRTTNYGTGS
jgi:hypothetical protein